jgi:hypothetical protein
VLVVSCATTFVAVSVGRLGTPWQVPIWTPTMCSHFGSAGRERNLHLADVSGGGVNKCMTLVPGLRIQLMGGLHMRIFAPRFRVAMALMIGLLALAACSPDKPSPAGSAAAKPSSPAASASPSAAVSGAPTALDAYRGMWKAYVEAIRIPDPSYPDLARYAQGDALNVFVNGLTSVQRDGLVGKGDVTINPSVIAAKPNATPPTVEIQDCVDTSQSHLVKKDGSPHQDTPGGKRKAVATAARLDDGSWKVISFALLAVGTC